MWPYYGDPAEIVSYQIWPLLAQQNKIFADKTHFEDFWKDIIMPKPDYYSDFLLQITAKTNDELYTGTVHVLVMLDNITDLGNIILKPITVSNLTDNDKPILKDLIYKIRWRKSRKYWYCQIF
ncbi:hypothetical protein P344_07110 [Spiroplasma mirum ATCC 29335]|uniref:Uncharacterized protein n=1 Tax=Spiroplasma mirum ATCC 29335 TaxID=838561 RepID=W0GN05_9MOLU|nr:MULTISPECIES: hypothetical protein [Spiroplasma]AHF61562.1 hypothetical protein SMM_1195 [Spiroplasma mirum ATCC 29335]AHI58718.1 hypothetical protein P344_07110 [Spiroplasma mirum ATCC 29335]